VEAVLGTIRKLGLDKLIASKRCRERDLARRGLRSVCRECFYAGNVNILRRVIQDTYLVHCCR